MIRYAQHKVTGYRLEVTVKQLSTVATKGATL